VPGDYNVQTHEVWVYVNSGENKLQFEGTGADDSFGLSIDNVQLVRDATNTNIVVNGNFEQPATGSGWGIYNNIPGWEGHGIELGKGTIYNSGWGSQVLELDGNNNYQITQRWNFDSNYKLTQVVDCSVNDFNGKTLPFTLKFSWAARKSDNQSPTTSKASVVWNGQVISSISASDYSVHNETIQVWLRPGNNILNFDGAGASDSYGITIDNVELASYFWTANLVLNGQFENPSTGNSWTFVPGGIPHWKAVKAEVGNGQLVYNSNWPAATNQVIELDSGSNQRYTQTFFIDQSLFGQMSVKQVAADGDASVNNHLSCASGTVQDNINCAV
jgi:hypothetical protein